MTSTQQRTKSWTPAAGQRVRRWQHHPPRLGEQDRHPQGVLAGAGQPWQRGVHVAVGEAAESTRAARLAALFVSRSTRSPAVSSAGARTPSRCSSNLISLVSAG